MQEPHASLVTLPTAPAVLPMISAQNVIPASTWTSTSVFVWNAKSTTVSDAEPTISAPPVPSDTPSSPTSTAQLPSPVSVLLVMTLAVPAMLTDHAMPVSHHISSHQPAQAASSVMIPDVFHALLLPLESA